MQVHARELGVVVEHLLEVRHEPALVGGVSVEAAAELVADAAIRHLVECEADHPPVRTSPRAIRRSRYSIVIGCGNLGAPPHDPLRVSNDDISAS